MTAGFIRAEKRQAVLLDDLETMAQAVPLALESNHGPLFELGLDICLTKTESLAAGCQLKARKHALSSTLLKKGAFV
ncbi:hypothetical protein PO124_22110 [Bacillus licheniformis]|nr:hypothetical protein [Bacillus licheniformis]